MTPIVVHDCFINYILTRHFSLVIDSSYSVYLHKLHRIEYKVHQNRLVAKRHPS